MKKQQQKSKTDKDYNKGFLPPSQKFHWDWQPLLELHRNLHKECWLQESPKIHGRMKTYTTRDQIMDLTKTPYDWVSIDDESRK